MAIKIIQGSDKFIIVRVTDDATKDPYNFTGVSSIRACFVSKTNEASLYVYYQALTGDTVNGSDLISNMSSTANIAEGDPVVGTGIPVGATVLKTPTSETSPTASGVIKISANATANGTGVALTIGFIEIMSAVIGKIKIHLTEEVTEELDPGTQGFEVKIVKDSNTSYIQFTESLDIAERLC